MMETGSDERRVIESATRNYVGALEGSGEDALYGLAKALDGLIAAYHSTSDVDPDTDELEARGFISIDEIEWCRSVGGRFPELGSYGVVDPELGMDQEIGLSLAVSDLIEILADLSLVSWLFQNRSANDAIWEFRFGYKSHWGRHAHEVRLYLHSLGAF